MKKTEYIILALSLLMLIASVWIYEKRPVIQTTNVQRVVNDEIDSILKGAIDSIKVVNELSKLNDQRSKTITIIKEKQDPRYEKFIQSIIGLRPDSTIEPHYQRSIHRFDSLYHQTNFFTRK